MDPIIGIMLQGSLVTLKLFGLTLLLSLPLGFLLALGRISKFKPLSFIVWIYTWLLRGTPLLLQLLFVYFGLGIMGVVIRDRFIAALIAFVLNYSAYFAEIFRGGILSIERGQYEAADVLGMSYSMTVRRIVLPQVFRRVLPPVGNEVITLIKDTSLVYVLGIQDMMRVADTAATVRLSIVPYLYAGAIYLVFTFLLTQLVSFLEKKFSYYE